MDFNDSKFRLIRQYLAENSCAAKWMKIFSKLHPTRILRLLFFNIVIICISRIELLVK